MSKKLNENSIKETMSAVRNNAAESKCITVFEELLSEISKITETPVKVVIADLNRFLEECAIIFSEAEKIRWKRIKAKMISSDFIRPETFFLRTKSEVGKVYWLSGKHIIFTKENVRAGVDQELSRKMVLLWNYLPAICKAVIQTKRRELGFDNNSTKFGI